jgi:uncharacterized protein
MSAHTKNIITLVCVFVAAFVLPTTIFAQQGVLPSAPVHYFSDYAHVVKEATAQELDRELSQFDKDTTNQVIVAIFAKMPAGEANVDDYTLRLINSWGVGQKNRNNGVALFVFTEERKLRIQVGYGLMASLPDALCKKIIDGKIVPLLRKNDFDGGIRAGVDALIAAIQAR